MAFFMFPLLSGTERKKKLKFYQSGADGTTASFRVTNVSSLRCECCVVWRVHGCNALKGLCVAEARQCTARLHW